MASNDLTYTLKIAGDFCIFYNLNVYEKVKEITSYTETIVGTGSLKKSFRWSKDNSSYSEWMDLSLAEIQAKVTSLHYFYIEFKYELLNDVETKITTPKLNLTYNDDCSNFQIPYLIMKERGNSFNPVFDKPFSWKPYEQKSTIRLYQDLSYIVNKMYGHNVSYFRATPISDMHDSILGEYTGYTQADPVCFQIIVPDNKFPDNKFDFNAFGIDFEIPFEVHIDKRMFESVFGHGQGPQKYDTIYFPMVDRIYDIQSTTLVRDFMQTPIYWKANLTKHLDQSHVIPTDSTKDIIDNLTPSIDKVLGDEITKQEENITGKGEFEIQTYFDDPVREFLDYKLNKFVVQNVIENYSTVISNFHYDISMNYEKETSLTSVRYRLKGSLGINENQSFTCWFKEVDFKVLKKTVGALQLNGNNLKVTFLNGLPAIKLGEYMKLTNTGNFSVFGKVVDISTTDSYMTILIDDFILGVANATLPNWWSYTNYLGFKLGKRSLLWNMNEYTNKGYSVDVYDSKYLCLRVNTSTYWFTLPVLQKVWYGLVIGFLNQYKQISVHLYSIPAPELRTTKLNLTYRSILNNIEPEDRSSDVKYEILNSPVKITNIRVLSNIIEEEKHSIFLNQNIISDASQVIVFDNAEPRYAMTKIGESKI